MSYVTVLTISGMVSNKSKNCRTLGNFLEPLYNRHTSLRLVGLCSLITDGRASGRVQNCPDARSVFDRRLSAAEATPTLQTQAHGCWDMREHIPKESGRSHHFSQRYLEISPE